MPKWINYLIQIVALIGQILNAVGAVLPPKYQVLGAGILGTIQAAVGVVAHYYNPDGTSAELPWNTGKVLGTVK